MGHQVPKRKYIICTADQSTHLWKCSRNCFSATNSIQFLKYRYILLNNDPIKYARHQVGDSWHVGAQRRWLFFQYAAYILFNRTNSIHTLCICGLTILFYNAVLCNRYHVFTNIALKPTATQGVDNRRVFSSQITLMIIIPRLLWFVYARFLQEVNIICCFQRSNPWSENHFACYQTYHHMFQSVPGNTKLEVLDKYWPNLQQI